MEKFRSFGVTHLGAKHEADVPCQDASDYLDPDSPDAAAMAIVADGHGSSRCFRSDIGSKKAVEIAKNCVAAFVNKTSKLPSEMTSQFIDRREVGMSESKIALNNVVREIIDKWFAAVMEHEEEHPLKDDHRLEGIVQKYKDRYINDVDYRCHAYGTTLMTAAMGENYWFAFQVGDGKCVVLYEDGSWDLPIPWDDRCTFNTTTSICDDDSLSGFRYWFGFSNEKGGYTEYGYGVNGQGEDYVREIESRPLAIFIGSDGVEDSYPRIDNDKYVINFYRNRIVSLAESGFEVFKEEIDGLAKRFADRESTDDVSIAGIIGDVVGKTNIAKMKQESEAHEKGEMAAIKRRDADEKKDALDSVQKRTDAVIANQKQIESKITSIESELIYQTEKKASLEAALAKSKTNAEINNCEMSRLGKKIREFEGKRDKHVEDKRFISEKADSAKKELEKAEKELKKRAKDMQDLQAKVTAGHNVELKSKEHSSLHQQLIEAEQRIRQVELEITNISNEYRTAETLSRNQREAMRQLQNDIAETEHNIKTKQAEIEKLNTELETLKEQTKKQTDTLAQIKAAWEKAKAEAQALEAIILNKQGGGK
ncbi:MAG: protein phosphatase 2C domain-containing protein [Oscillospiraceae bacterium]|nr:protein phosphatase 2C domain-containing protein [Oscillospiraceae bacterium]